MRIFSHLFLPCDEDREHYLANKASTQLVHLHCNRQRGIFPWNPLLLWLWFSVKLTWRFPLCNAFNAGFHSWLCEPPGKVTCWHMADGDSCRRMPLTSYTASLGEKMSLIVASFKSVFNAPVTAALQPAAHPQQHEGLCSVWRSWSISRDVLKIMHFGLLAEFLHAKQASNPASDLLLPPPIQAQAGTRETLPWWERTTTTWQRVCQRNTMEARTSYS